MTRRYDTSRSGIEAVAEDIKKGGVAIFPTETCYGIGGDALNEETIDRVYRLKERPRSKGLTVIVGSLQMAERYCRLNETERALCREFMPGPLTLVANKKDNVPDALNEKFVFRVPGYEPARLLSELAETPVIATSANKSGQPENYSVDTIDEDIVYDVDTVLDGGRLDEQPPSTIVEVTEHDLRIHRDGPIDREALDRVVN